MKPVSLLLSRPVCTSSSLVIGNGATASRMRGQECSSGGDSVRITPRPILLLDSRRRVTSEAGQFLIARKKKTGKSLLNKKFQPVGSFMPIHYTEAKSVLDTFRQKQASDTESVNMTFELIERIIIELDNNKATRSERCYNWLGLPKLFTPFITNWKTATENGQKVALQPKELLAKLHKLSTIRPQFKLEFEATRQILSVAMKSEDRSTAPLIAEELFQRVINNNEDKNDDKSDKNVPRRRLDLKVFNELVQIWSVSGRPESEQKIDRLYERLCRERTPLPNMPEDTLNLFLTFWGQIGAVDKINALVGTIRQNLAHHEKPLELPFLTHAQVAYCRAGDTVTAKNMLREVFDRDHRHKKQKALVYDCVLQNFEHYRKRIIAEAVDKDRKDNDDDDDDSNNNNANNDDEREPALKHAEQTFEFLESQGFFDHEYNDTLFVEMMNMYAHMGKYNKLQSIAKRFSLRPKQFTILIKAIGTAGDGDKKENAEKATSIFLDLLQNSHVKPQVETFNAVIQAWGHSSSVDPSSTERAFEICKLVKEDPTCNELGIRPTTSTFVALMTCLANSNSPDAGEKACELLDEMDRIFNTGDRAVRPNETAYTLAIHACLKTKDVERADAVMNRMVQSNSLQNIRAYNHILRSWGSVGTVEAAQRAEKVFVYMKQRAVANPRATRPNLQTYQLVVHAWANTGDPVAANRLWLIYEEMKADEIEPNSDTLATMISAFSKSTKRTVLEKASFLLQYMANHNRADPEPERGLFLEVAQGWLTGVKDVDSAERVLMWWLQSFIRSDRDRESPYLLKATELLKEIQEAANVDEYRTVTAKQSTYETLLRAWDVSCHPEKERVTEKIEMWVAEMFRKHAT